MTSAMVQNMYDFGARVRTEAFDRSRFQNIPIVAPVLADPPPPNWLQSVLPDLPKLGALGENWDGAGAEPIRSEVLEFVSSILSRVMSPAIPAPTLIPMSNGGIQMLWSSPAAEIEVELIRPNEALLFHRDRRTAVEDECPVRGDYSPLANALARAFR